ncbi:angiopoietin-related protein 4-like [Babylonia areolata]|uniref:angiopoietin-related protein 4-like n=1 Tax=Babylonia areolata TaxID=304850 RepID=UPI003FCFB84A
MQTTTFSARGALLSCCLAGILTAWHGPCSAQAGSVHSGLFRKQTAGTSCLPTPADPDVVTDTVRARSAVDCARHCAQSPGCSAFGHSALGQQCHLVSDVTALTGSCDGGGGGGGDGWKTWVRSPSVPIAGMLQSTTPAITAPTSPPLECENEGVENNGVCQCKLGFVGNYCERLPEDCKEAMDNGDYSEFFKGTVLTMVTVKPALSPQNMTAMCRQSGQTMILMQSHGYESGLNFTWQEYVDGFTLNGVDGAYWIGLRNLYYITNSKQYNIIVYFREQDRSFTRIWYLSFKLLDDVTFKAQMGSFKGADGDLDLLSDVDGSPFSTYDHAHGNADYASCALKKGGGWWYGSSCATVNYNLVGRFPEVEEQVGDLEENVFYGRFNASGLKHFNFCLENV